MPEWTQSMRRTYEFYKVDPETWMDQERLDSIISASINWDLESDTLGSASIDTTGLLGEMYIRVYMVSEQANVVDKRPIATILAQTPSFSFDGKVRRTTLDAYTPLIELKENQPPIGYFLHKGSNVIEEAAQLVRRHARAPVFSSYSDEVLDRDFVAKPEDTWFTFISDLLKIAKCRFGLDEMGHILFEPLMSLDEMTPRFTYSDDSNSIITSEVQLDRDIFGIPNRVEVIYTGGGSYLASVVTNDDPNSPTSVQARGRLITNRITDPQLSGDVSQEEVDLYAKNILRRATAVEGKLQYTHAWCGTRLGDCVIFNYSRAGLGNVKARILSQSIKCTPDCPVQEGAQFKLDIPVNKIGISNGRVKVQEIYVILGTSDIVITPDTANGIRYISRVIIRPMPYKVSPNKEGDALILDANTRQYSGATYLVPDEVYQTQEISYNPTQESIELIPQNGAKYFTKVYIRGLSVNRVSYNEGTMVSIGR